MGAYMPLGERISSACLSRKTVFGGKKNGRRASGNVLILPTNRSVQAGHLQIHSKPGQPALHEGIQRLLALRKPDGSREFPASASNGKRLLIASTHRIVLSVRIFPLESFPAAGRAIASTEFFYGWMFVTLVQEL